MKKRLTSQQKKALENYNFMLREEDRYLGSVFVTPSGQAKVEAETKKALNVCLKLGMTFEHGL